MLLQLEIIVWASSLIILLFLPVVRGYRLWKRKSKVLKDQKLSLVNVLDDNPDNNGKGGASGDDGLEYDDSSDELNQATYQDPVIAALRQEEQLYLEQEESENVVVKSDQDQTGIESEMTNDDLLQSQETTEIQDSIISEELEVVAVDHDGDGTIDEILVQQTTTTIPADLAKAKHQKSLEMIEFELRSLKEKGQTSAYEKKLIEARALHPKHNEFTTMLADYYYDQSEYKKALGLYRKMVDIDSTDDKSLAMVANCYIKLGERENSQIILEKLVQDRPENPRYWMSLAEVYYNFKNIDKTIDCVRTMVKLRPTNMDYLSTLAQLYHESAYYDLYVQILYRMLELDPLNHEIKAEIEKYS